MHRDKGVEADTGGVLAVSTSDGYLDAIGGERALEVENGLDNFDVIPLIVHEL